MLSPRWIGELSTTNSRPNRGSSTEQSPKKDADPGTPVAFTWGHKITLRDGVRLNATVYRPQRMSKRLPVIFTLTPYIGDTYHDRAYYFARNGYVFALVDVRGRGNSEGEFEPFANEGRDGFDIVEHLAKQSWSNGKVAMWGGSYAGYDQWATLKEHPPHLATIVPAASVGPGIDFPFFNGIWFPYMMQWLTLTSGASYNSKIFEDPKFWIEKFQELYKKHLPFRDLDKVVGNPSKIFQKWLGHGPGDPYWKRMRPTPDDYRRMEVPILTITGHYDGDQPGAMHYYHEHQRYSSTRSRAQHYLIMGPWDHPGTRTPKNEHGGLKFGDASVLDLNKLHKEWYDWTLKNGKRPSFLKKRYAYYVGGSEEWKYADTLEKASPATWKLYLNSKGGADDPFQAGSLDGTKPRTSEPDKYTYDPLDNRPSELDKEDVKDYLLDQRYALNLFRAGLVYHSQPATDKTEITGNVRLTLWMSIDVPDMDFAATLYEITPNGRSIALTFDALRARYRESRETETLTKPGQINKYEFNHFYYFSRRIEKFSRLRLLIQPPNTIFWERNYNTGDNVADESGKQARTGHVTVYHDAEHPSILELPLAK